MRIFISILVTVSLFSEQVCALDTLSIDLTVELSEIANTEFVVPIPPNTLSLKSRLKATHKTRHVSLSYESVLLWPNSSSEPGKIRLLKLTFPPSSLGRVALTLEASSAEKEMIKGSRSSFSKLVAPSDAWLNESLMMHPRKIPVKQDWYIEPQKMYAKYVTDLKLLEQDGFPYYQASQWLYDRPSALFQLYMMSGDKHWLEHAKKQSDFYEEHIGNDGFFILKEQKDFKYIMPKGLLYSYLMTGKNSTLNAILKLYKASLGWDPHYDLSRGFWTERNQGGALNAAVTYWEVSANEKALVRATEIVDATFDMTFNPGANWKALGCPLHALIAHEGKGDNSPVCSPWMMAQLAEPLWRFYLLTANEKARKLLESFGDYMLNYGIYFGNEGKIDGAVIPKYLVALESPQLVELEQWADIQHTCDVAAMVGKSVHLKALAKRNDILLTELFSVLVKQCKAHHVKFLDKPKLVKYWRSKPPRKFNWMYSSTSDLPWLESLYIGPSF